MTQEEFVGALERYCRDVAVDDCIANLVMPPGRKPAAGLVALSHWYSALPEEQQSFVRQAMTDAAHATLFGVLCVIDGVRSIDQSNSKTDFELVARRSGKTSTLAPGGTFLHDLTESRSS